MQECESGDSMSQRGSGSIMFGKFRREYRGWQKHQYLEEFRVFSKHIRIED